MSQNNPTVLPYIFGATLVTYVATFAPPCETLTIQPLLGMFIVGAMLLLIGIWVPELATSIALLILVTSLVINGTRVVGAVNTATNTSGGGGGSGVD